MKKIILLLITTVFMFANSAFAELFSASVGIPVSYKFSDDKLKGNEDGDPSGMMAHVKLPFLMGLGIEKYTQNFASDQAKGSFDFQMLDVSFMLPIPIINVTVGAGLGTGNLKVDNSLMSVDAPATLTQYYVQVGFPLLVIIDIHASIHMLQAPTKAKIIANGSTYEIDPSGTMMAIGASVGF